MENGVRKAGANSCAGDKEMLMVRNELEAAEALAGLAHSSILVQQEEKGHVDDDDRPEKTQQPCSAFHVPQVQVGYSIIQ